MRCGPRSLGLQGWHWGQRSASSWAHWSQRISLWMEVRVVSWRGLCALAHHTFFGHLYTLSLSCFIQTEVQQNWRQVLKETVRNTRAKSWSYMKGFGSMGLLFSGAECVIEKVRERSVIGVFSSSILSPTPFKHNSKQIKFIKYSSVPVTTCGTAHWQDALRVEPWRTIRGPREFASGARPLQPSQWPLTL